MRRARLLRPKCHQPGIFGAKSAKIAAEISLRGEMI
jgi:hypothetical protein